MRAFLKFGSCCQKDNIIYFYNMSFNAVFYLELENFSVHFLHSFSHESIAAEKLSINGCLIYENAIYFFPNNTNAIMRYDFVKQQEQIIYIKGYDEDKFKTAGFVQQGNIVYLFPSNLDKGIYVLDLIHQKVVKDIELSALFDKGERCGEVFRVSDESIILNIFGGNKVIEINLNKKKIVCSKVVEEGIEIFSMHYDDGQNYWFLQMQSTEIYTWNRENNTLQKYVNNIVSQDEYNAIPYSNMIFLKTEILVLSYNRKNLMRINRETKTVEDYVKFPENIQLIDRKFSGWPICFKYSILPEQVLIYPAQGNMLLIYNKKNHQIIGKEMQVSEKDNPYLRDISKAIILGEKMSIENNELGTLNELLDIIRNEKPISNNISSQNIGQLIYRQENI